MEDMKLQIKQVEGGRISGYASIFDEIDSSNEYTVAGAFSRSIETRFQQGRIVGLNQHNQGEPIWRIDVLREDDIGLYFEGEINLDLELGREVSSNIRAGIINGVSIGGKTRRSRNTERGKELIEFELFEISIVTLPSNDNARVESIKSMENMENKQIEDIVEYISQVRALLDTIEQVISPEATEEEVTEVGSFTISGNKDWVVEETNQISRGEEDEDEEKSVVGFLDSTIQMMESKSLNKEFEDKLNKLINKY